MKVDRITAIRFLDRATATIGGYDDFWCDIAESLGVYDAGEGLADDWPTLQDLFLSLGVTQEELVEAGVIKTKAE